MARSGWVKLSRAVLDDPLLNKDPEHLALWVHLLCNAAFEPTLALLGNERVTLQPGQLTTGRKQLAVNSGISESKIERTLKAFENAQLIEQQTTSRNRLISIVSWSEYSASGQQNEQQVNNNRTTTEQQANTLEELKNIRTKEKRILDKAKHFIPPTIEEVRAYCQSRNYSVDPARFIDYYESNGWKVGKNKMQSWKAAVRTWEGREKNNAVNNTARDCQENGYLPGVEPL